MRRMKIHVRSEMPKIQAQLIRVAIFNYTQSVLSIGVMAALAGVSRALTGAKDMPEPAEVTREQARAKIAEFARKAFDGVEIEIEWEVSDQSGEVVLN